MDPKVKKTQHCYGKWSWHGPPPREGEFGSYYRIHAVLRIWITVKSRILDLDQNWSCTGSTILDLRALLDLGSWIYAVVLGLGSWIYAVVLDLGSWIYVGVRDLGSLIYVHRSTGSRILDLRKTVSLIRLTFGFWMSTANSMAQRWNSYQVTPI